MKNIFSDIPHHLPEELFETILETPHVKIERIVSNGHITPPDEWYDQNHDEWVLLLEGEAKIKLETNQIKSLNPGDFLWIPAHQKHQVIWTAKNQKTIWLAIHFG